MRGSLAETFALSRGDRRVDLWCEPKGTRDGLILFEVINGLWDGEFDPVAGTVYVVATGSTFGDVTEVWRGAVPRGPDADYNEAMAWIREQL